MVMCFAWGSVSQKMNVTNFVGTVIRVCVESIVCTDDFVSDRDDDGRFQK